MKNSNKETILIIGLGNPLKAYFNTYHNTGFNFIDYLLKYLKGSDFKLNKKLLSEISIIEKENKKIILAKPTVFMNESGKAVKLLKEFFKVPPSKIYVVHDDSDLNLKDYKIQFKRGSAGHKGVESIFNYLKTKEFYRIRIGIRAERFKNLKAQEFVLKPLSIKDKETLKEVFLKILRDLETIGII